MSRNQDKINPFFFRELKSGKVVISNLLASTQLLENRSQLLQLVEGEPTEEDMPSLRAKGFLSEGESDQLIFAKAAEMQLTRTFRSGLEKPSLVIVVPTLRCDHSCQYCQVSRAPLDAQGYDLELDICSLASSITRSVAQSFKLEFQGGEPLLRRDIIIQLVSKLRHDLKLNFEVVIASALGPELDDEFLKWCLDESVRFSVSFDGIPELHSRVRRSTGFDSFSRTQEQLAKLRSVQIDVGFVATLTSDALNYPPASFIEGCLGSGINRIYSRPLQPYGFANSSYRQLGCSADDLDRYYASYIDEIIRVNRSGTPFWDYGIGLYLEKVLRRESVHHVDLRSPAGYALSTLVVNYDGKIYGSDEARMLAEDTGLSGLAISDIGEMHQSNFRFHQSILASSFIETSPHCDQCVYSPFCGSDPMHHLYASGDAVGFKSESLFCQHSLRMFDLIVEKLHDGSVSLRELSEWAM